MKDYLTNQRGFTLIEALIAMVILAIALLSLTTMQVTAIKGNAKANSITSGSTWGADFIEEIFSLDYDDLVDSDDDKIAGLNDTGNQADLSPRPNVQTPDGIYSVYINVAEGKDVAPMPNTKKVRIVIVDDKQPSNAPITMDYIKHKYM